MSSRSTAIAFLQDASAAQWAVLTATIIIAALLPVCAYRIFFHPLHRYPGPILHALSDLPRTYSTMSGKETQHMYELHLKYGPVVRVGPDELSYVDPRAMKDIYGHHKTGQATFAKDPTLFEPAPNGAPDILRGDDGATHARQRKALSHSFSDRALKSQEELLKMHVGKLLARLAAAAGPVDLVRWYSVTTFDIMADLTFSAPLGLLDGSTQYEDWMHAMTTQARSMTVFHMLRRYPAVYRIVLLFLPLSRMAAERKKVWDHTAVRVEARLAHGSDKPDLWEEMTRRDGSMSVPEMHANAEVFMGAGTETTASLLAGLTFYLATSPEKMDRLKREVREAIPGDDDVTIERLQSLKYLNACIEEGLRKYPPSAIGHPRVTPAEGARVCDGWVPGGTMVSCQQWVSYHYPANFARPHEFIPERWLETETGEFANDKREILQPFSYGPRNCIGKK